MGAWLCLSRLCAVLPICLTGRFAKRLSIRDLERLAESRLIESDIYRKRKDALHTVGSKPGKLS